MIFYFWYEYQQVLQSVATSYSSAGTTRRGHNWIRKIMEISEERLHACIFHAMPHDAQTAARWMVRRKRL